MTINLQTLKCNECSSSALRRTGPNQYRCDHCGSTAVVEDSVSEKLDRVLDQVKDAAAERLAREQAARNDPARGKVLALTTVVLLAGVFIAGYALRTPPRPTRFDPHIPQVQERIPPEGLRVESPVQVVLGEGSGAEPKLLFTVRNETGRALGAHDSSVEVTFHGDSAPLGTRRENLPLPLAPGETAPIMVDLPQQPVARQEVRATELRPLANVAQGPRLALAPVRLVQTKTRGQDEVRLVGRVENPLPDATLLGVVALATLYDDRGGIVGFGKGRAEKSELPPGEHSLLTVRMQRFAGSRAIAAWDYRIHYEMQKPGAARMQVLAEARTLRAEGSPEAFSAGLQPSAAELLADTRDLFDPAQLELAPLVAGRNQVQHPVYLTEIVNRSTDAVVLRPGAVITQFDGSKPAGSTTVNGLAYLYPGERYPVALELQGRRITQTRVEWKLARRTPLPGPRPPLEVRVEGTRAELGSVLLNFSQRFTYKYVEVRGSVKNPGPGIVRNVRVQVVLRDQDGQLTGFNAAGSLAVVSPGESVPFTVEVEQQGRDFATVETLYQTD